MVGTLLCLAVLRHKHNILYQYSATQPILLTKHFQDQYIQVQIALKSGFLNIEWVLNDEMKESTFDGAWKKQIILQDQDRDVTNIANELTNQ